MVTILPNHRAQRIFCQASRFGETGFILRRPQPEHSGSKRFEVIVMATMTDVAKRAGVAPITVSRVINKAGYVSEETRQRVEQAIADLNYVPNALGTSLRSKRTNTLALVLTDITNPFWTT